MKRREGSCVVFFRHAGFQTPTNGVRRRFRLAGMYAHPGLKQPGDRRKCRCCRPLVFDLRNQRGNPVFSFRALKLLSAPDGNPPKRFRLEPVRVEFQANQPDGFIARWVEGTALPRGDESPALRTIRPLKRARQRKSDKRTGAPRVGRWSGRRIPEISIHPQSPEKARITLQVRSSGGA